MKNFTEEQKAEILKIVGDMKNSGNEKPDENEQGKAPENKEKSISQQIKEEIEASKTKSIIDQAKEEIKEEKQREISLNKIQESVKFNLGISDFVEKNKSLLPEESEKILTAISGKTFKDDNEKANTIRKTFLDSFLEKQENIDALTNSMKARAEQFKALAESDKERKSNEFWDLVEIGVALKQGLKKAEALNMVNGGNIGDSSNPLEAKILAMAEKKFNNNNINK